MVEARKTEQKATPRGKREKLPPKGTAARALMAAGLWSDMSREEIDRLKQEIFSNRRSAR